MASIEEMAHVKVASFMKRLLHAISEGASTTVEEGAQGLVDAYKDNEDMDTVYDKLKEPVLKGLVAGIKSY